MSIIFISHDLGLVAEFAEDLVVLYGGRVVEQGCVRQVFERPRHPYTEALLRCVPPLRVGRTPNDELPSRLPTIPGQMPSPAIRLDACRFADRCTYVEARCREHEPPLEPLAAQEGESDLVRRSRCFFAARVGGA